MTDIRSNTPRPFSRLQFVNDPDPEIFKNPLQLEYIRMLVKVLRDMDRHTLYNDQSSASLLLVSPNGTTFRVTVADDGTLTTVNARA